MKYFLIIYCTFVVSSFEVLGGDSKVENTNDGKIIELNKHNFKQTIANNDYVFISFYLPWFKKRIQKEFEKTANILKEKSTKIILSELGRAEMTLSIKIMQYPTLVLYRKGVPIEYFGKRLADDITEWILRKIGPPTKTLTSVEDANSFINSAPVVVIGFFKDLKSDEAQIYQSVALKANFVLFGITSADIVFSEFDARENTVLLFKKFDYGNATFEDVFNDEEFRQFIQLESQHLIKDEDISGQEEFLTEIKNTYVYIFLSRQAGNYDKYVNAAKPVAKKFKNIRFVAVNVDSELGQVRLEDFSVKKKDVPAIRIWSYCPGKGVDKYKPEVAEVDENSIQNFVLSFIDKQFKPYFPSQDLPADWDKKPVKILVGTNYDSVTLDESKIVLVNFYVHLCEDCIKLEPILEEIAEKFKSRDDIVIAKINTHRNKLEHLNIKSVPTLILYVKGNKEAIQYKGKRTLEELIKFIESEGTNQPTTPSDKETTTQKGKTTNLDDIGCQT